jgi:hypothetical protein
MSLRTFLALLAGFALGFGAAMLIVKLLYVAEQSKSVRSAADASTISHALETYRQANGRYPPIVRDVTQLTPALAPTYVRVVPSQDIYGTPYLVLMDGDVPAVISTGKNGFVFERGELIANGPAFPELRRR